MRIGSPDLSPDIHPSVSDILDKIASVLNQGTYSFRTDTAAPTISASDESSGEARLVYSGGGLRLYIPAQGAWWYVVFTQV